MMRVKLSRVFHLLNRCVYRCPFRLRFLVCSRYASCVQTYFDRFHFGAQGILSRLLHDRSGGVRGEAVKALAFVAAVADASAGRWLLLLGEASCVTRAFFFSMLNFADFSRVFFGGQLFFSCVAGVFLFFSMLYFAECSRVFFCGQLFFAVFLLNPYPNARLGPFRVHIHGCTFFCCLVIVCECSCSKDPK